MTTIVEYLQSNSSCQSVEGNHNLPLNEPDKIWLVCSGSVDIFSIPLDESGQPGARIHLCRVQPGEILCGCDYESKGLPRLIATGLPGSEVAPLTRTELSTLLKDQEWFTRAELAGLLERWIEVLTSQVSRRRLPHDALALEIGTEQTIPTGKTVSPTHGVGWIVNANDDLQFLGRGAVPPELSAAPFPVSASGWMEISEKTQLTSLATTVE